MSRGWKIGEVVLDVEVGADIDHDILVVRLVGWGFGVLELGLVLDRCGFYVFRRGRCGRYGYVTAVFASSLLGSSSLLL